MSNNATQSSLICLECGNIFLIMRNSAYQKELYSRKKVYCPICKKVTSHFETKNIDLLIAELSFKSENDMSEKEKTVYQLIKKKG